MSKKTEESSSVPQFKKYRIQLISLLAVFFTVVFAFFLGVFAEFSYSIVQKNTPVYNFLQTVGNQQQVEVHYYELEVGTLKSAVYDFVKLYFGEDDPRYVERVTDAYVDLITNSPKNTPQNVFYYIALCSVESNFRMSARSKAGAVGIAQVMWSVWGKVIQENYGISKESLYTSVKDNIRVGYMIWSNYLRQSDYSVRKANAGYLGTDSLDYHNKINFRYVELVSSVLKSQFESGIQFKTIVVESGE